MYPEFPENWGNGGSYTAVQPDGAPRPSDVQLSSDVAWGSQRGVGGQDLSPLPNSTFLTEAMTRVQSHRVRLTQSDGAPRPSDTQRSSDAAWGSQWGVGAQDLSPLPKSTFLNEVMTRMQLMQSDGSTCSLMADPSVTKGDQTGEHTCST